MGLSFEESLKNNSENNVVTESDELNNDMVATMNIDDTNINNSSVMTLSATYSADSENWVEHRDYVKYQNFYDDDISVINDTKDITLNKKQFNITQEENSQYISFEMPRYYDGFDLVNAVISIHYKTKNDRHGASKPVNVIYNNEKIRFGWLVDAGATIDVGMLEFEIHAYGSIVGSDGVSRSYVWKTKRNKDLNVLESLCDCEDVINDIDDTWVQELITDVAEKVADEIKNVAVGEQVAAAEKAANDAEGYANTAKQYAENAYSSTTNAINTALENYATTQYVNEAVASVDVTDQLEDYVKTLDLIENYYTKSDTEQKVSDMLENYTTKDDVATAIAEADISEKLNDYYTKSETYSQTEIDEKIDNIDLTGYATETYVNTKTDSLTSSIDTNTENISSLSKTVGELQGDVNSIDKSPRLTYDVAYNDTEDADVGENVFVFYEIENEGKENEVREAKKKFTIVGGSGGSASSSLKIGYVTTSPLVVTVDDKAVIKYTFSGTDSSGDAITEGVATWKIGGRIVATNTAINGENSFDVTEYLSIGTQKVVLSIQDDAGSLVTKTWNVQKIDVRLESTFNDKITYPIGKVSFDYTPYGAISKEIHFVLDGEEIGTITTASSGIPMAYEIPIQEHGSHLFEVYITAVVNGNAIESNHIVKDILWYDSISTIPVIGTIYQNFTARQYDVTNIEYTVYDPTTETPTVEIAVDGVVVSTPTLSQSTNVYSFKSDVVGEHIITITCGETVKTLTANIEKIDINIAPVTAGLAFDFDPSGKSNNDVDRIWTDGTVSMSVSDNFDWVNGGYQFDENGDQYFCIKAGTSATIDYKLFEDDAKKNGKEMKLVFKTTNVAKPNATFLSCVDNTTDSDHIGIQMDVHEAFIYGQAGKLHLPYSEEDIIEFEFNISKNTEAIPMVMGYEDGVSTAPMVYDDSHNFTQNTPKVISLGSEDCDLHIYRFKVYNTSLTDRGILNNFIADARNAEEMIARFDRNQIYDENGQLNPDVLAEKCPWLRIIKIEAPYFTNNKSDKVPNTTIEHIYKGGDPILDNWKAYDSLHSGQGTSSNNYGAAGRNLDLIIKSNKDFGNEPYIVLGDGSRVNKVSLTRKSVPVNYFNVKVNIASSENANNALLQRRYNTYNPYNRAFVREEGYDTSIIKNTMEFKNCVVFIKETNTDLSTHREFADNDWHFYAIGNIGDSKKTDSSRLTDPNDRYECCVEIMDVELRHSDFPTDENAISDLQADNFDESGTYGFRYIWEDGTDEENAEVFNYCKQKWIEFYDFVINSTDEEFKTNLGNYFVVDSALYYYLFTSRYLMIDNRAKNTFWHYGKTGEVDSEGNPIRKWDLAWDYDNDKRKCRYKTFSDIRRKPRGGQRLRRFVKNYYF